ncbi:hypothetical protein [Variovorax sp. PBL-H6]|nr:hypothetical protein [Variovorax sp. PBL-H6]
MRRSRAPSIGLRRKNGESYVALIDADRLGTEASVAQACDKLLDGMP